MRTSRTIAALILSLSWALAASACIQEPDTLPEETEETQETGRNEETATAPAALIEDGERTGTSELDAPNQACVDACVEANARAAKLCNRLRSRKAREACFAAANLVMAYCIANCPEEYF